MRLRVATWNLHAGVGLDGRYDLERAAAVLRDLDADVVGLQEVDVRFSPRSGQEDMAGRLGDLLGRRVAFGPALGDAARGYGVALLTREPVEAVVHPLPWSEGMPYAEQRVCLEAAVAGVQVLVTHLQARPAADRGPQWEAVLGLVRPPSVLLGDLNTDVGRLARRAGLVDAGRRAGRTFRADHPLRRIDGVLVTPGLAVGRAERPRTRASDHLPVAVELRV